MRKTLAILGSLLAFAPIAEAQTGAAKRLDDYLQSCHAFGWSGTALVAVEGRVVLAKGYGMADREAGRANDAETLFEIASITKTFTACAILRLCELEKLGLDDSIALHLPGVPEDKACITIRHLLAHTSGMARSVGGSGTTVEDAVRSYLAAPRRREPGAAHEYWNGGYALLAGIVERASGTSYTDFLRAEVLERAGMETTGFTGDQHLPADRIATGYEANVAVRTAVEHPYGRYDYGYQGMGGIVTSASDLWRFAQAFSAGRVLGSEAMREMTRVVDRDYGLGIGILRSLRGTRRLVHGGDVRGFHAQLEILPDEKGVIVVLDNVPGIPPWKLSWTLGALLFGETPRYKAPPSTTAMAPERQQELAGVFQLPKEAGRMVVTPNGGGLLIAAEGQAAVELLAGGGRPPDLSREVAVAELVLAAVLAREPGVIAERMADARLINWPRVLVERIWPDHVAAHGELVRSRVLGAVPDGKGKVRVVMALEHASGEQRLAVDLLEGKLARFDLKGPAFPLERSYAQIRRDELVGWDWAAEKTLPGPRLVSGRGKPPRLVFPRHGGQSVTLTR